MFFRFFAKNAPFLALLLSCFFSYSYSSSQSLNSIEQCLDKCEYYFCVDGGGSKTALQVLDQKGRPLTLHQKDQVTTTLRGECSNIVVVGENRVQQVLQQLFSNLEIGDQRVACKKILSKSAFIGGFAGLGREETKKVMHKLVKSLGFHQEHIALYSDATLALELVGETGGILIGGTGSIVFIKDKEGMKRFGGLGYRIGDMGSGYWIGLEAIKATIENEYGYEQKTSLSGAVKKFYNVDECKELVVSINSNQLSSSQIASLSPIVFQEAWKGDEVAYRVVEKAAHELGDLLAKGVSNTDIKHCMTYLIGGLFQNEHANQFIHLLFQSPKMQALSKGKRPVLVNVAEKMFPALVVQEKLRLKGHEDYQMLSSLPIVQYPSPELESKTQNPEFLNKFNPPPQSSKMSRTFFKSCLEGLQLVQSQDLCQIKNYEAFVEKDYVSISKNLLSTIQNNHKIFLIGTNNQNKNSLELAQKWNELCMHQPAMGQYANRIQAIDAEHLNAFINNEHKVQQTVQELAELLLSQGLEKGDSVVFLASDKQDIFLNFIVEKLSNLNVSPIVFTDFVYKTSCKVESAEVEHSVSKVGGELFRFSDDHLKVPVGCVLNELFFCLDNQENEPIKERGLQQIQALVKGYEKVSLKLPSFREVIDMQFQILTEPSSALWAASSGNLCPLVMFFSTSQELKDVFDETMQQMPCFCVKGDTYHPNLPNVRSLDGYLLGMCCSFEHRLIASNSCPKDSTRGPFLNQTLSGTCSCISQNPNYKNQMVVFVSSSKDPLQTHHFFSDELTKLSKTKLKISHIQVLDEGDSTLKAKTNFYQNIHHSIVIDSVPYDPMGLTHSMVLKQTVKLLSQGAWITFNRVYGDMMIDVMPLEEGAVERALKTLQGLYQTIYHTTCQVDEEILRNFLLRAMKYKALAESQLGKHIPSPAKLVFTMLEKKCDIETAVATLKYNNENVALLMSDI